MGKRRVKRETAQGKGLFHVFRFQTGGGIAEQIGSNLTRDRAEEYVKEMQACDTSEFKIIRAKD